MCFCQTQVNSHKFHSEQGRVIRISELMQQDGRGRKTANLQRPPTSIFGKYLFGRRFEI